MCIINIKVPHEVKINVHYSQLAKKTFKKMNNGQDVIIQSGSGTGCSG